MCRPVAAHPPQADKPTEAEHETTSIIHPCNPCLLVARRLHQVRIRGPDPRPAGHHARQPDVDLHGQNRARNRDTADIRECRRGDLRLAARQRAARGRTVTEVFRRTERPLLHHPHGNQSRRDGRGRAACRCARPDTADHFAAGSRRRIHPTARLGAVSQPAGGLVA